MHGALPQRFFSVFASPDQNTGRSLFFVMNICFHLIWYSLGQISLIKQRNSCSVVLNIKVMIYAGLSLLSNQHDKPIPSRRYQFALAE
jgi:hypothetical protein